MNSVLAGLRTARAQPGFALTAILTLAIGIGLSTAVFTVAEALLLRRLPVAGQDEVVVLWGQLRSRGFDHYPLGWNEATEFGRQSRTLEGVALATYEGATPAPVRYADEVTRLDRAIVSGAFFDVLGVAPVLGRALRPEDDISGAAPVAVLSHAAWQQRFGGDPNVLGRRLLSFDNAVTYTIVGVMPQGLDYPRSTDFWAPILSSVPARNLQYVAVDVVGRLTPAATAEQARLELGAFFSRSDGSPWQRELTGVVHTLPRLVLGEARPAVIAFAVAAALLLLITCTNVANLLLVRGISRQRELAVRSALGAERGQLVRHLLGESVVLALAGGALGFGVAAAAVGMFVSFAPADVPRLDEIQLNGMALLASVAITGLAMLIFSVSPALVASRTQPQDALRSGARQSASRRSRLVMEGLAALQVALALVVLSAAGLIVRSLVELQRAELALEPSRVLIAELAARFDQYDDVAKQEALLERLLPAVEAIPGVRSLSPVVAAPFSGTGGWDGRVASEQQTVEQAGANPILNMEVVGTDYFRTLGISVVRGRPFTDIDGERAAPVVIVSQTAAQHYWPNGDPIGERLRMGSELERSFTVVGVVSDTRYRDLRVARPSIYFPLHQSFFPFAPTTLAIRTDGDPTQLVPSLRPVIAESAPGVALVNAQPFTSYLDGPLAQPRLNALLLSIFAGAALVLAAVGLFGVMSTLVRQRTRELGVRMALGATTSDLKRMVVRRGFTIAVVGVSAGLIGALFANRLIAALFYGVTPTDALTMGAVAIVLLGIAILASLIPARAITRVEATAALKSET